MLIDVQLSEKGARNLLAESHEKTESSEINGDDGGASHDVDGVHSNLRFGEEIQVVVDVHHLRVNGGKIGVAGETSRVVVGRASDQNIAEDENLLPEMHPRPSAVDVKDHDYEDDDSENADVEGVGEPRRKDMGLCRSLGREDGRLKVRP